MAEYGLELARPEYEEARGINSHRVLYTGIPWLDIESGGFRPSEVAVISCPGRFIRAITSELCVRAVGNCEYETVFVDGANTLDPYGIAAICKRKGLDRNRVLSMITVSRAFTAHQMAELIIRKLPKIIEKNRPSVVLVSCLLDLFLDRDMNPGESLQLVKRCMAGLKELTARNELITLVTNPAYAAARSGYWLGKLMDGMPDRVVRLDDCRLDRTFSPPRPRLKFNPALLPRGQTALDGFFGR